MSLRIATFNVENLMNRFDFSGFRNQLLQDRALSLFQIENEADYRHLERARMISHTDDARQLSALAIAAARADVICLQEVENIEALRAFEYGYLFKMVGHGYREKYLAKGNDMRGIEVAIMFRTETAFGEPIEFVSMQSHAHVTFEELGLYDDALAAVGEKPHDRVFRRDCVEVDLKVAGRPVTIYLVHFKSMGGARNGLPGRESTMPVRMAEAAAVRAIIEARFGPKAAQKRWAICGDLNDYRERIVVEGGIEGDWTFTPVAEDIRTSLDLLTEGDFCENVAERLPPLERWTLYHTRGPQERHLCQLDYVLVSGGWAQKNATRLPQIITKGQPWRTPFPPGQSPDRWPRIGWDRPKASDHCPVVMELDVL